MQKFNINNIVVVILTEVGANIINEKWARMRNAIDPGLKALFNSIPTYKAGDVYRSQLWQLMQDFGDYMSMSLEIPFKDCSMYIFEKDLTTEEVDED